MLESKQEQQLKQHPLANKELYEEFKIYCHYHEKYGIERVQKIFDKYQFNLEEQRCLLATLFFFRAFRYHFVNKSQYFFFTLDTDNKIIRKNFNKFNQKTDLIIPTNLNLIFYDFDSCHKSTIKTNNYYNNAIIATILLYINPDNIHQLGKYQENAYKILTTEKEKIQLQFNETKPDFNAYINKPFFLCRDLYIARIPLTEKELIKILSLANFTHNYQKTLALYAQGRPLLNIIYQSKYLLHSYIIKDLINEI